MLIAGNYEDKYNAKNFVYRKLVSDFLNTYRELLEKVNSPKKILEVGAGEGYLTKILCEKFPKAQVFASDISEEVITEAQQDSELKMRVDWQVEDLHKLKRKKNEFDLVVCCEVLEHTNNPQTAIRELYRVTGHYLLVSVPQEPIWRILNCCRGKYVTSFGNTPGHVNHWSPKGFRDLVTASGFIICEERYPFPWTMLLVKKVMEK